MPAGADRTSAPETWPPALPEILASHSDVEPSVYIFFQNFTSFFCMSSGHFRNFRTVFQNVRVGVQRPGLGKLDHKVDLKGFLIVAQLEFRMGSTNSAHIRHRRPDQCIIWWERRLTASQAAALVAFLSIGSSSTNRLRAFLVIHPIHDASLTATLFFAGHTAY
jgi:hypothetical protein